MEDPISLQNVANIVTFVAPGYFAIQMYHLMHEPREREFSRVFIESVVYSSLLVALTNVIWLRFLHRPAAENLSGEYSIFLLGFSIIFGTLIGRLRALSFVQKILKNIWYVELSRGDFLYKQLLRVDSYSRRKNAVTVTLKSGAVFSATIDQLSRYSQDTQSYCSFTNLAWFDSNTGKWDERKGNLIISREEIEYIETQELANHVAK